MSTIGERIRATRTEKKISRKALARAAGIAYTTLSDLELGESKSSTALHRLAERLDVDVDWLETGRGSRERAGTNGPAAPTRDELLTIVDDLRTLLALTAGTLASTIPSAGQALLDAMAHLPADQRHREFPAEFHELLEAALARAPSVSAATQQAHATTARKRA